MFGFLTVWYFFTCANMLFLFINLLVLAQKSKLSPLEKASNNELKLGYGVWAGAGADENIYNFDTFTISEMSCGVAEFDLLITVLRKEGWRGGCSLSWPLLKFPGVRAGVFLYVTSHPRVKGRWLAARLTLSLSLLHGHTDHKGLSKLIMSIPTKPPWGFTVVKLMKRV